MVYILQGIDGQFVRFRPPPPPQQGPRRTYARGEIIVNDAHDADTADKLPQNAIERAWHDGIEFVLGPVVASHPHKGEWSIAAPTRVLLHTLAELGWLYRLVEKRVEAAGTNTGVQASRSGGSSLYSSSVSKGKGRRQNNDGAAGSGAPVGMVEQSLHAALKDEMTEYFRLVAELEAQLGHEEDDDDDDDGNGADDAGGDAHQYKFGDSTGRIDPASRGSEGNVEDMDGGLTLRRLLVWTEDVKLRMRLMATLVEEAGGK